MDGKIERAMGSGGIRMQEFLREKILKPMGARKRLGEIDLVDLDDASVVGNVALTTDSHTVFPFFFPGGSIGSLSVAGTVNDLAVLGAKPAALTLSLVIEEGFPMNDLERIIDDISRTSKKADAPVVTGDTKVVERGGLKGIITNTAGVGFRSPHLENNNAFVPHLKPDSWIADGNICGGEKLVVTGDLGDHGFAVLSQREGYGFEGDIRSDVAPLNELLEEALKAGGVVSMKDPTRGGLANLLNEWSQKNGLGMQLDEESIPVNGPVRNAGELLGIDPFEVGNEGKAVLAVMPEKAEDVLTALKSHPLGKDAKIIGFVERSDSTNKRVVMRTSSGGRRVMETPMEDPVPRIC